ncbi:MAG TPA: RNase adapter RapZ, partial [Nocardioides sp.]|nr:RNase adapter RapZ [Nocardioides sp.]
PQNGRDPDVSAYVLAQPKAEKLLEQYLPVLETVAEGYLAEGKRFMQVAVGCTGGKHRSVAMTEEIAGRLRKAGYDVSTAHRDLGRE